ncbi:MAG: hypothetical protein QM496_00845 [Verrucomicrobiota bacterium]
MKLPSYPNPSFTSKLLPLIVGIACSATFTLVQAGDKAEKKCKSAKSAECASCKASQDKKDGHKSSSKCDSDKTRDHHAKRDQPKGRPPGPPHAAGNERKNLPPEAQKFSERIRDFHQQIGSLYREGKRDEAREVTGNLREFIQDHAELARKMGPPMHGRGPIPHPGHHPPAPKAAGRPGRPESPKTPVEEIERRLHHILQAAENLEQAGMEKESKKLRQQAEHMERELQKHRQQNEGRSHGEKIEREMNELRELVGQLKKEIEQLKRAQKGR